MEWVPTSDQAAYSPITHCQTRWGAAWTFLSDPGRIGIVQKNLDIQEYTDPSMTP
jgi:hypothetical protein